MKKTLFTFLALVAAFAATSCQSDEDIPQVPSGGIHTGKATATINGKTVDVNWIQLWENGPKFAEYNVGVEDGKAESYGDYYEWDDTAIKQWGNNWRVPTKEEFDALLNNENCTYTWTTNYKGSGIKGLLCIGKGDYSSSSVFFPAAGYSLFGKIDDVGIAGYCWSSTPDGSYGAYYLRFYSDNQLVYYYGRDGGCSIRMVLAE